MTETPRAAAVSPSPFLITKEYRRFAEFCDVCRRDRYIGLCYGPPGVGKSLSARHYAPWDLVETVRPRWYRADQVVPAAIAHCRTVFYTPPVANTPRGIVQTVRDLRLQLSAVVEDALRNTSPPEADQDTEMEECPDCTTLLIVDEADRLKIAGLEQLRDLYDHGTFGVILMGMPGLENASPSTRNSTPAWASPMRFGR
jgi:DNA transposition AAA+ family ATPase